MNLILLATYSCLLVMTGCGVSWAPEGAEPIEVTLCGLYQHPEQYADKVIKVRGGSVSGLEIEDLLHDSQSKPCPAYMRLVVVFPDKVKPPTGFQLVQDESYEKLAHALSSAVPVHIDATYVGRFDAAFVWRDHKRIAVGKGNDNGYGKKHEYDARIVLRQVSDVWAEPLPRK